MYCSQQTFQEFWPPKSHFSGLILAYKLKILTFSGLLTQKSNAIQGKRQNFTIDIPDIQVQKVSLITNIVISKKITTYIMVKCSWRVYIFINIYNKQHSTFATGGNYTLISQSINQRISKWKQWSWPLMILLKLNEFHKG